MSNLSVQGKALYDFLVKEYIDNGYMYSGSWPYDSLLQNGFGKDQLSELQSAGLIQRRNCEDYAFELTDQQRKQLITRHNLCSVWFEKTGPGLLDSIQEEVKSAAAIPVKEDGIEVSVMKLEGDDNTPVTMTVQSSFSVGQTVNLEYDLPTKKTWTAYNHFVEQSPGSNVGQFMVTDIIHNPLVTPNMNMFELQSLGAEFNKMYPFHRAMLLFEDDVLKRLRTPAVSLNDQIKEASDRSGKKVCWSHNYEKLSDHDR